MDDFTSHPVPMYSTMLHSIYSQRLDIEFFPSIPALLQWPVRD